MEAAKNFARTQLEMGGKNPMVVLRDADLERALHFVEHSEVGLTHVNVHSAYKEPQQSFGGVKESGFGLPEAGSTGIQFFQEEKSIYIRKGPPTRNS